jgi:hypothetical protein
MSSSQTDCYEANLYPAVKSQASTTPVTAVCLSGGGSRALTCALGQLSSLNSLPAPNNASETLLSQFQYLSSVSGGTWASVLYTFLPSNVSDADFLIEPAAPGALTAAAMETMGSQCLGIVPQQFNISAIADYLGILWQWGFFDPLGPDLRNWFWIAGVGELVLKPFGLYNAAYSSNAPYLLPDRFFSLSADYIEQNITSENLTLTPVSFYTAKPNRPTLIVNTNLIENYTEAESPQIPVQATAQATGVPGESPDKTIVGGGSVESFAFTSSLAGAGPNPQTAMVDVSRCYSLCDITGCSSAFFAELLLHYINIAIDGVVAEVVRKYHLSTWAAGLLKAALQLLIDSDAAEVVPQYNYWPLGQVSQPQNTTRGFSDGGSFDNTGILGLLAQTSANRIVAFVNSETPLGMSGSQVVVDTSIPLLFGSYYPDSGPPYVSFGGMSPSQPLSYVQVFSNANNELDALCQGLYNASCGGANQGSSLGTYTAAFTQTLVTVDNPVANIAAGRQVTVVWVYNNRVNNWQTQITDATLLTHLTNGQSNENSNGTLINNSGTGTGPLANFPNYYTVEQIYLPPEAVNMLAQLSAWNVQQIQSQIGALLS